MSAIRLAAIADFAAIHRVELSAGLLFSGTHMAWAVGETTSIAELTEGVSAGLLWVDERDHVIAGFLLAVTLADAFLIREVAVARDFQGRRIGAGLIEVACAEAAYRGFRAVMLTTDRSLAWNAPWYARLGFHEVPPADVDAEIARLAASERDPERRCIMRRPVEVVPRADSEGSVGD